MKKGLPICGCPAILRAATERKIKLCGRGGTGRHARLKILFLYRSVGSIPTVRTNISISRRESFMSGRHKIEMFSNVSVS